MLTVTRRILVSAPRESVRLYLRDLQNMSEYEPRADNVEVSYPEAEKGFVEASGKFLGLPWRGAFNIQFTPDGGYRSEMVRGPLSRMIGSFHLRSVAGGTAVTHEEHYQFSVFLRPLARLFRGAIGRSMDRELGFIKEGAERLHRQIQIRQIEAAY